MGREQNAEIVPYTADDAVVISLAVDTGRRFDWELVSRNTRALSLQGD